MAEQRSDKAEKEKLQPAGQSPAFPGSRLAALAPLYGLITTARNKLYDSGFLIDYAAPLPVICVGNATVGGSGKSPIAAALAAMLAAAGRKPVILSRGYGGSTRGPRVVAAGDSPGEVGDEALMHLRFLNPAVPVVISRDRVIGAGLIFERKIGDTIILDDGYQHRRLRRDLNLLLIDISSEKALNEWTAGQILPAGRFREKPEQALKRADAVVLVSRSAAGLAERRTAAQALVNNVRSGLPLFTAELYPEKFIDAVSGAAISLEALRGKKGIAVCGLAQPEHFYRALTELGLELSGRETFRDHHPYSKEELKKLLAPGEPVFTTAKDAVKFAGQTCQAGQEGRIFVLLQAVRFGSTAEGTELRGLLLSAKRPL